MTVTRTVYGAPADSAGAAAAEAARAEAAEAAEQARALAAEATDASQAASAAAAAAAEATRAAAAEGGLIPLSQRGAANGVGTLDAGGRQPIGQSPTGLVRTASNGSDFADVDATRANLKVPTLRHAQCVATTNQALSGALPTIDAYAVQDGDRVLLTGQSTGSQNGMWIAHTAGWARPSDYPASGVLTSRSCKVTGGTVYAGTDWYLASTASITVDTSSVTWKPVNVTAAQLPSSVVSATSPADTPPVTAGGSQLVNIPPFKASTLYPGGYVIQQAGILYSRIATGTSGATLTADAANWTALTLAGVELGYAEITTNVNSGNTATPQDVSGLTTTVTVGARPIVVIASMPIASSSVSNTAALFTLVEDGTEIQRGEILVTNQQGFMGVALRRRRSPAAGSHTYKVQYWGTASSAAQIWAGNSDAASIQVLQV